MNHPTPLAQPRVLLLALAFGLSSLAAQQSPSCSLAVLDQAGMRLLDLDGTQRFFHASNGFPQVTQTPIGPRWVMTDRNGSQIYERFGAALGPIVSKVGGLQYVAIDTDRIAIIGDQGVQIRDLDGTPIGIPIPKSGSRRQTVKFNAERMVVVDSSQVRIFDRQGVRVGPSVSTGGNFPSRVVMTSTRIIITHDNGTIVMGNNGTRFGSTIPRQGTNWQSVRVHRSRIIVIDDVDTRVFDLNRQALNTIPNSGARRQSVVASGDRLVIADELGVDVTDLNGVKLGSNVFNSGLINQAVDVTGNRIIITDDNQTDIFDKLSMRNLAMIPKVLQDRQNVVVDGNRVCVTDQVKTRIFDENGVLQGSSIQKTGNQTQVVRIEGDRLLVIDSDQTRVFDRGGQMLRSIATKNVPEFDVLLFSNLISITGQTSVSLYNRDGVLQGQPIRYTLGVQHVQVVSDRAIIVDGNRLMIFDLNAKQIGNTRLTQGDPEVYPMCWDRGSFTPLGSGCAGSQGMPTVVGYGYPRVGGFAGFLLQNAPPNVPVSMNLGFSTQSINGAPLPLDLSALGAPGCMLHNDAAIVVSAMTAANGTGLVAFFIPPSPALTGLVAHGQFIIPDPAANTLGLTVSNSLSLRIGEGF